MKVPTTIAVALGFLLAASTARAQVFKPRGKVVSVKPGTTRAAPVAGAPVAFTPATTRLAPGERTAASATDQPVPVVAATKATKAPKMTKARAGRTQQAAASKKKQGKKVGRSSEDVVIVDDDDDDEVQIIDE